MHAKPQIKETFYFSQMRAALFRMNSQNTHWVCLHASICISPNEINLIADTKGIIRFKYSFTYALCSIYFKQNADHLLSCSPHCTSFFFNTTEKMFTISFINQMISDQHHPLSIRSNYNLSA